TRAAPEATESTAGGFVGQLSSQKSEAEAQSSFRSLQAKFPNELGDLQPIIRRADLGSKGGFYRTLVGPFTSAQEASQVWAHYKAGGGQSVVPNNWVAPAPRGRRGLIRAEGGTRFHHRPCGYDLNARRARVPARARAVGVYHLQAQHRDPGAGAPLDGVGSRRGRAGGPRARGPGRRPRPASRTAALAALSAGGRLWPPLRPQRGRGANGRLSLRPPDRRRSGAGP